MTNVLPNPTAFSPDHGPDGSPNESKNIILLLDGTWNDSDFGESDTNIVRLRERISDAMHEEKPDRADQRTDVREGHAHGIRNVVFYQRGVGTGAFDRYFGGALGIGLSKNVREAYRFLCAHFSPCDRIFIFGFSRGAYTARSLAGYVAAAGILRADECTPANESRAWHFYRERPASRMSGVAATLRKNTHEALSSQITCIGVFDTVGALGIPIPSARVLRFNRELYEFHDVDLTNIAAVNLQALAIDEHRRPFEPTIWCRPKFARSSVTTEQVWFAGCHADIGGGNIKENERPSKGCSLDDLTLEWMLQRLDFHEATKQFFPVKPTEGLELRKAIKAAQFESRRGIYRLYPTAYRSIAGVKAERQLPISMIGLDRHRKRQNEMLHISALMRIGEKVKNGWLEQKYMPANLVAYVKGNARLPIVDWDGTPLTEDEAIEIIAEIRKRIGT